MRSTILSPPWRPILNKRTGFTADVFGHFLQRTIFSPVKTTALLIAAYKTQQGQALAQQHPKALRVLQFLTFLSILRRFNAYLNRRVLDNAVDDPYDWTREVVLLTGGSNGIGRQIALRLARRGITVVILDIQPPAPAAGASPSPEDKYIHYFHCDITSSSSIAAIAPSIRTTIGAPTILINNAGLCTGQTILSSTEAQTRKTFELNTLAHYHLAREFLPSLVERDHGMVVTVSSQCGFTTTPNMVDYSASKAAALAFHEGLAAELVTRYHAPRVRTVLVAPGFTRTALIRDLTPEDGWFNPLLEPETVAGEVVGRVLEGRSARVVVPGSAGWCAVGLRGMPLWLQCGMRNYLERLMRV